MHWDVKEGSRPVFSVLPCKEFLWLTCWLTICSLFLVSAAVTPFFFYFPHFHLYTHIYIKAFFYIYISNPHIHSSAHSELPCFSGIWQFQLWQLTTAVSSATLLSIFPASTLLTICPSCQQRWWIMGNISLREDEPMQISDKTQHWAAGWAYWAGSPTANPEDLQHSLSWQISHSLCY